MNYQILSETRKIKPWQWDYFSDVVSLLLCGLFSNPNPYSTSSLVYEGLLDLNPVILDVPLRSSGTLEISNVFICTFQRTELGVYSIFSFSPQFLIFVVITLYSTVVSLHSWSQCWSVEGATAQSTGISTIHFVTLLFWITGYKSVYKFN